MATILSALSNLFTLLFVVTSMFSVGLALTIPQILDPLRNTRLIILALVANFVVVPAVAWRPRLSCLPRPRPPPAGRGRLQWLRRYPRRCTQCRHLP